MANIFITGGAGYIGAALVPKLLERGDRVTVYDKLIFGKDPLAGVLPAINLVQGDIRDVQPKHLTGMDGVIHLAGVSNDPTAEFNPESSLDVAIRGTEMLIKACKQAGVGRLVFASSCSVYYTETPVDTVWDESTPVEPRATYSKGKRAAELKLLEAADKSFCPVMLRKGTVHGFSPRMRYDLVVNTFTKDAYKKGKLTVHSGGRMWRPLLDIQDACAAYLAALDAPAEKVHSRIFNILSINSTVLEIARAVQRAVHKHCGRHVELEVQEVGPTRSYRVNGDNFTRVLGIRLHRPLEEAVTDMWADLEEGRDPDDPIYYNMRWMELLCRMEKHIKLIGSVF
jgi:nucleoside-diphosphate-sugar epimerase